MRARVRVGQEVSLLESELGNGLPWVKALRGHSQSQWGPAKEGSV